MATGDLNNNVDKVRNELTSIRYDGAWNSLGISEGSPEAYLPLVHYVCVNFSRFLARFLAAKGYELVGKNDMRFMEEVYKILRNEFNYRPALNLSQFFTVGFAERKLILVCDLIKLCKRKHNEISKQKADAKRKTVSSPSPSLLRPPSPQVNTSKRDFDPENSLRKSGGSLNKSGLESSHRRRSGSTGSNTGMGTPTVPKKFVASASLVNNEIDVVDFRPNVSAARPPIRVIRNEPKHTAELSTPSHLPRQNHASTSTTYASPAPPYVSPAPSSSYTSPAHYNPPTNYATPSIYANHTSTPTNPSNPPLPSSSAYASRSADGAWQVQEANGYTTNRYARGEEREDVLDVEDVEPVVRDDEEEEEESEGGPFPAVFKEFRANGKLDGEREIKQDNGYSGASMSHIGSSREGPITDKVAMHILDKLAQVEVKVLSSINSLQTSIVSLESRVKNLESLLDSSPKRAVYQAPQQPTLSNSPHKHTINYQDYKVSNHTTSLSPSASTQPPHPFSNYSPPSHSGRAQPLPSHPTLTHSPPSHHNYNNNHHTFAAQDDPKVSTSYQFQSNRATHPHEYHTNQYNLNNLQNIHNTANMHFSPNGHQNDGNGSNSDTSSTSSNPEKDRASYKPTTQSTQDFISSITKRFRDTRELLSQQSKQQTQLSSSSDYK